MVPGISCERDHVKVNKSRGECMKRKRWEYQKPGRNQCGGIREQYTGSAGKGERNQKKMMEVRES